MNADGVTIDGYWNGSIFQPDIAASDVVQSVEDARLLQGSVQTQDLSFDVVRREVTVGITLV
jgi:hypothetical protein